MNKYTSIVSNTIYVALGTIGSKLIYVLMLPLYTRWLATEEFGAADSITTFTDILITIIFLNISDAIFVYPKTAPMEKKKEYFSSGLIFLGAMSVFSSILICCTYLLGDIVNQESVFFKYKWIIFLLMITRYLQYYTQSFVRSLDMLRLYSFIGVILTASIAVFSIAFVPFFQLEGYIFAIIFAQLSSSLYTMWRARLFYFFRWSSVRREPLVDLLKYSLPLAPNSIMWWLISGLNRPLMESKLGLAAIGIYAVANKISGTVNAASSIVSLAWCNSVLDEYGKLGFDRFYNNYLRVLASIYFICCFFLIVFSEIIVKVFSTSDYYEAASYIPLLAIGLTCSGLGSSVGTIYAVVKKSKYFFYSSLWGGCVSIATIYPLMHFFGIMGVCLSLLLAFLAILISRWYYASSFIKIEQIGFYIILLGSLPIVMIINQNCSCYIKYTFDIIVLLFFLYIERFDLKKIISNVKRQN